MFGFYVSIITALTFGAFASFVVRRLWTETTAGLMDTKIAGAFGRALVTITMLMSLLAGVGPLDRKYRTYEYTFLALPDSLTDLVGFIYNTGFAVAVGTYPILVVVLFSSFILQVGLARARIGK